MEELGVIPLVAVHNDKCIGETEFMLCNEPQPYFAYGYLSTLVIHKDFRKQVIGTELVKECLRKTKVAGFKFFDTVPEDERSLRLYNKLGLMKWKEFPVLSMSIEKKKMANSTKDYVGMEEIDDPSRDYTIVIDHWSPARSTWKYFFDKEHRSFLSASMPRIFRLNLENHRVIVALDHWVWNMKAGRLILLAKPYSSLEIAELKQMVNAVRDKSFEMGFESVDARGIDTDVISKMKLESLGFTSKPAFKKESFLYLRGTTDLDKSMTI